MATNNTKKSPTKAELEAQIEELKAQLMQATAARAEQAVTATPAAGMYGAPITFTVPSTDVSIVYCSDSMGYASISNMALNFNRYGEEFTLSRSQFDELVGKYRHWFDKGILAVSYKNMDIAVAKGLKTDREMALDVATMNNIGKKSVKELEALWNSLDKVTYKESIVSLFKRKFIEQDPAFMDREKIDLMNRLTNGGFAREQDELSGRYKIAPTIM